MDANCASVFPSSLRDGRAKKSQPTTEVVGYFRKVPSGRTLPCNAYPVLGVRELCHFRCVPLFMIVPTITAAIPSFAESTGEPVE
jgi:hypothetical protein